MGTRKDGVEIGCRIEGSLFSPGSKNNSHSVKKQLRITKTLKGKVHNSGGSLEVKQVERHRQAWAGYHNAGGWRYVGTQPETEYHYTNVEASVRENSSPSRQIQMQISLRDSVTRFSNHLKNLYLGTE